MMPSVESPRQDEADPPLLVGREREQRFLRGHLAASVAGRGRLVLVGGTAGMVVARPLPVVITHAPASCASPVRMAARRQRRGSP